MSRDSRTEEILAGSAALKADGRTDPETSLISKSTLIALYDKITDLEMRLKGVEEIMAIII